MRQREAPLEDTWAIFSPNELPDVDPSLSLTLLAIGFAIAVVGHLYKAKPLIAAGLITIVVAVIVLPLILFIQQGGGS